MSTLICSFDGLHDSRVLRYCADFEAHNLAFLSALKLLEQLTEKGLLTVDEAEKSRIELERKLRPTLLFA